MPRKKLRVVTTGAGDPTFRIEFQIEDGDGGTLVCSSIDAGMGRTAVLSLDNNNFTPPMNKDIIVMSSFPGAEVTVTNGLVPVDTTVSFKFNQDVDLENDTGLEATISGSGTSNPSINFTNGITALPGILGTFYQVQQVAFHSRDNVTAENAIYVFLDYAAGAGNNEYASGNYYASTRGECNWILDPQGGGYYTIKNIKNDEFMSYDRGALAWSSSLNGDNEIWRLEQINDGVTFYIENKAAEGSAASFLTTDSLKQGGDVRLVGSGDKTAWYIHTQLS